MMATRNCRVSNIKQVSIHKVKISHDTTNLCVNNKPKNMKTTFETPRMKRYSFAVIAPSLWNRLPPLARAYLLSSNLSTSLSLLKTCLFSWS